MRIETKRIENVEKDLPNEFKIFNLVQFGPTES